MDRSRSVSDVHFPSFSSLMTVYVCMREMERQREGERQTHREREAERQRETERDTKRGRHT